MRYFILPFLIAPLLCFCLTFYTNKLTDNSCYAKSSCFASRMAEADTENALLSLFSAVLWPVTIPLDLLRLRDMQHYHHPYHTNGHHRWNQ